ncbi:MAG TPA: hypothetical protein VMU85_03615 [Stellaceae bacterium]|nr:hypothetical protein [Stellaceae bacterium]
MVRFSDIFARFRVPPPPLIDRGFGLIYEPDRNLTWLMDANYARTVGHSPDGQLTWDAANAWVSGLSYQGIRGWRLPSALNHDGSGPYVGFNCFVGELGHFFTVAQGYPYPDRLPEAKNFDTFAIYWTGTEAPPDMAYALELVGFRQGTLRKDPFSPDPSGITIPLPGAVLTWPVHDGDVAAQITGRWLHVLVSAAARLVGR